jgi:D-glycero-alpha-D-manno-heptose-7-phosphate kinase
VDLAGGTLDIWPIGLLHAGARTVNVAIDLAATVELSERQAGYRLEQGSESVVVESVAELSARPEAALLGVIAAALDLPPVDIGVRSESPRGAGLGASSALAMAAIAAGEALLGRAPSAPEAASSLGRDLEACLMGLPTGKQDQLAALLGGALEIRHAPGGERVRRLDVDLERLGESLIVAYSGQTHFSAGNNWQVVKRRLDGDPEVVAAFEGIAAAAAELPARLESGDLAAVGRLMTAEWDHRRRLAPEVSTPVVEALIAAAIASGAWGAKVCGAGGGGCVAVLASPDRRAAVSGALAGAGARVLATRPVAAPLEVRSSDV